MVFTERFEIEKEEARKFLHDRKKPIKSPKTPGKFKKSLENEKIKTEELESQTEDK